MNILFGKVENVVEIGENAGNLDFLLFPQCFQKVSWLEKAFSIRIVEIMIMWYLTLYLTTNF